MAQTYVELYSFTGGADGGFPNQNLVRDAAGNLYGVTGAGGASNQGTVFKLDPAGSETVLHSFSGLDGAAPIGTLVRDASGNLYGTTYQGGVSNQGTIFKVDTNGTETVLYSFTNAADGSNPSDGLVMDAASNLYGIVETCGVPQFPGCGGVYKLDTNGNFTMLHYFSPGTVDDGAQPSGTLVLDKAGNLYGTTSTGGPANVGTIFKIDTSAKETVVYAFSGKPDGAYPFAGLVQDEAGNFYGTTFAGGSSGDGTVFKLDATGAETVLYSFLGGTKGDGPEAGVARDTDGNFYGTTMFGGYSPSPCHGGCGVVFKLSPTGSETVLHTYSSIRGPDVGVILDGSKNLYGTDWYVGSFGNGVVFEISAPVAPPDFSLTASTLTPASVSAGGSATSTIDIAAIASFSGAVAFSCSVQPAPALAPQCSVSPNSASPGTPSTLTVITTAPTKASASAARNELLYALWMPVLGALLLGCGFGSRHSEWRSKSLTVLAALLLLAGLSSELACGGSSTITGGGGGGSKGTPAGAYTVTVTGTAGSLQHSTTTTLTVQ